MFSISSVLGLLTLILSFVEILGFILLPRVKADLLCNLSLVSAYYLLLAVVEVLTYNNVIVLITYKLILLPYFFLCLDVREFTIGVSIVSRGAKVAEFKKLYNLRMCLCLLRMQIKNSSLV